MTSTTIAPATAAIGTRAFLDQVASAALAAMHELGGSAKARRRWTMLQVSFGMPTLHYEVWVQRPRGQLELGLHFEASPELNEWLLQRFAAEMIAIRGELGTDFELEQWTKRWGRIHTYVPYDGLTATLADDVAATLTSVILCLQPRLEFFLSEAPKERRRERARRRR